MYLHTLTIGTAGHVAMHAAGTATAGYVTDAAGQYVGSVTDRYGLAGEPAWRAYDGTTGRVMDDQYGRPVTFATATDAAGSLLA